MPFLGGLFSRKSKPSPRSKRDDHATSSMNTSELDSALSSPTTSYVKPDNSIPSHPNARNLLFPHPDLAHELPSSNVYPSVASMGTPSTGKKLRLPFTRKKVTSPKSDLSIGSSLNVNSTNFNSSSRSANNPRQSTSTLVSKPDPEELRRLRPPPSRSAIFAAYGDPTNNLSIHSLPDEASVVSRLSFPSPSPAPQSSKKTSLFSWSKGTSKSTPRSPLDDTTKSALGHLPPTGLDSGSSFNLKSFRHIREPSTTRSNASNVSLALPAPRPRLRGESINSDSSQRISVAAFREVQARRSVAGSPSPSFRTPSPVPVSTTPQNRNQPRGRQSSMLLYTSDSDSSTSSEDEDEDETIKRRPGMSHSGHNYERKGKAKAKSEVGHKSNLASSQRAPQSSHSGHSKQSFGETKTGTSGNGFDLPPRSKSSLGHHSPVPKLQTYDSNTASSSFATVKLAGTQVTLAPNLDTADEKSSREASLSTHSNSQSLTQRMNNLPQKHKPTSDSEDDSEDDAPLSTLLGSRRPGSAMSSYSSVHAWSTGNVTTRSARSGTVGLAKPLIDINELTGSKPSITAAEKSTSGFTQGSTLLSGTRRSMSPSSVSTENPSGINLPLTSKVPPMNFVSPPSSPSIAAMRPTPRTVDGVDYTAKIDSIILPSEKSASPEQPRNALTERLSRAVNIKVVQRSSKPSISSAKNSVPALTENPNMTTGDISDSSRKLGPEKINFPSKEARPQPSAQRPAAASKGDRSPIDEGLAELLGTAGINFMFRNDEASNQSSESESEEDEDSVQGVKRKEVVEVESESEEDEGVKREKVVKEVVTSTRNGIAPIPIKERPPTSSFSVTSRPPFPGRDGATAAQIDARLSTASNVVVPRPRSITLTPSSNLVNNDIRPVPSNVPSKSTSNNPSPKVRNDALKVPNVRQRSSTMVTGVPLNAATTKAFHVPERPFATRRNSPASSTEDSSSGRAPLTPRDGSEIDIQDRKRREWSGGPGGLGVKNKHVQRRSVSFEEDHHDPKLRGIPHSKGKQLTKNSATINDEDREARRKERRRGEAKASIELGNVVNGPAPILDDEDEIINHNINPRMSTLNPMMGMGFQMPMQMGFGSRNSVAWGGNMGPPPSPYLIPAPADPNFLAAHQQAMMYAKQAYQMAVARQAMAAAGDEWERGSSVGGYGGGSMISASSSPAMMSPQFGMMPMGQGYGWSGPSSVYLPSSSQSIYGGVVNSGGSEHGGVSSPKNWPSSKSSYGDSFGPSLDQLRRKNAQGTSGHAKRDSVSTLRAPVMPAAQPQNGRGSPVRSRNGQRDSTYLPPMPASQFQDGRGSPDTSRTRTGSRPGSPPRSTFVRKAPPPSSWKASN